MDAVRIGEWKDQYIRRYSLYQDYTKRMEHLVQDLIEQLGLDLFHIESSTKSIERFVADVSDPNANYADPFADMSDISCVRVILYFAEDLDKVSSVIEEEFGILRDESISFDATQDPDAYGYRSIEYTVFLSTQRGALREWSKYGGLKARIQIRTILQNAWAAITRKLPYDEVRRSKSVLKRKLSRMSALLEEADEGFLSLWEFVKQGPFQGPQPPEEPRPSPRKPSPAPAPGGAPMAAMLEDYFKNSPQKLFQWVDAAKSLGYPLADLPRDYQQKSLDNLALILGAANIGTPEAFDAFFADMATEGAGRQHLLTIHRSFEGEIANWRIDPFSVIFLMVLNAKWETLQHKDLIALGIKAATDRIKGVGR